MPSNSAADEPWLESRLAADLSSVGRTHTILLTGRRFWL